MSLWCFSTHLYFSLKFRCTLFSPYWRPLLYMNMPVTLFACFCVGLGVDCLERKIHVTGGRPGAGVCFCVQECVLCVRNLPHTSSANSLTLSFHSAPLLPFPTLPSLNTPSLPFPTVPSHPLLTHHPIPPPPCRRMLSCSNKRQSCRS